MSEQITQEMILETIDQVKKIRIEMVKMISHRDRLLKSLTEATYIIQKFKILNKAINVDLKTISVKENMNKLSVIYEATALKYDELIQEIHEDMLS